MTVFTWSTTAATNATADGTINWAEGQSPSSVNDSSRAEMAAVAKYRNDHAGTLTTGGTSTAYTLTSNQVFTSLSTMNGQSLRIKFNATNGASPTLNVDSLGAKGIQVPAGTAVGTGAIVANTVHDLVYDNANACWVLIGPSPSALIAPAGTVMIFRQTAAPTGWTKATSLDDYALRLTNGTVGTGGTAGFTAAFAARTITQAHLPSYTLSNTLSVSALSGTVSFNGAAYVTDGLNSAEAFAGASQLTNVQRAINGTSLTGTVSGTGTISGSVTSGGSGTAMDFAVKYADVTAATKD